MLYKTAFGIQSNTQDNKHIFMYDCDDKTNKLPILKELISIQKNCNLSNMYILETDNGYNAFTLDKLDFSELIAILYSMDNIDTEFVKFSVMRKYFTLRMNGTKKITDVLINYSDRTKSYAHYKFFNEIMLYNMPLQKPYDNNLSISICAYPSRKHGVMI